MAESFTRRDFVRTGSAGMAAALMPSWLPASDVKTRVVRIGMI